QELRQVTPAPQLVHASCPPPLPCHFLAPGGTQSHGDKQGSADVHAALRSRPAAEASSRIPGSICWSAIEEMPRRMKRERLSGLSKKRLPGSITTPRAAAASAITLVSAAGGP